MEYVKCKLRPSNLISPCETSKPSSLPFYAHIMVTEYLGGRLNKISLYGAIVENLTNCQTGTDGMTGEMENYLNRFKVGWLVEK